MQGSDCHCATAVTCMSDESEVRKCEDDTQCQHYVILRMSLCQQSECQFQTENSVVRGNTLHHTDGHEPRGIQGEIAQAGTGRGLLM